ncbi:MAG: DUF5655 domain-containing protein [Candidatus Dojkabacteria bacterium]|nr:MAG: DUF5655 domain-containing protein [Candidatus Dojkabacteria bacterium]
MKDYSKYLNNKSPDVAYILNELFVILDKITAKDYEVEEKQTSLHIVKSSAFLGVHFLKDKLRLNIVLNHVATSDKLHKSEQVSKNRFHNEIDLRTVKDLSDIEMLIKEAYFLKT